MMRQCFAGEIIIEANKLCRAKGISMSGTSEAGSPDILIKKTAFSRLSYLWSITTDEKNVQSASKPCKDKSNMLMKAVLQSHYIGHQKRSLLVTILFFCVVLPKDRCRGRTSGGTSFHAVLDEEPGSWSS